MAALENQESAKGDHDEYGFSALILALLAGTTAAERPCTMSVNPYDTAWVAMVVKPKDQENSLCWLFPEAFAFLVKWQAHDGSWSSNISDLDAILSTMAALLALLKHQNSPKIAGCAPVSDLVVRIARSVMWLESKLQAFDINSCPDNVGFEVILPSLLRQLRSAGVEFLLPRQDDLFTLAETKLAKLDKLIELLYQGSQSTVLHSLEALIGRVDFDRLKNCKKMGGMLGSPSSTAAYMMQSSAWDEDAERFLQNAFRYGDGNANGGFASAHSIDYFETSWILSTILESKVKMSKSDQKSIDELANYLQSELLHSKGILGFSRDMIPDADDTAKCIYALRLLDRHADPHPMITHFQTEEVFKTYGSERTPSLSTNCNVLKALLVQPDAVEYGDSVHIALDFICKSWFGGRITDKWNVANEYTYMLLAQGLATLVTQREQYPFLDSYFDIKVPVILSQILSRVLRTQSRDGSWGEGAHEVTAYCALTLVALGTISFPLGLNEKIISAILLGREYLSATKGQWRPEPIWIEKVRYSSKLLTDVYCVCALATPLPTTSSSTLLPSKKSKSILELFKQLPLFSTLAHSELALECALAESQAFLPYLQNARLDIFPRSRDLRREKYMEIIPFAWTASNALRSTPLPADILIEMMMISLLNFQVDEYFELITKESNACALRFLIDEICGTLRPNRAASADPFTSSFKDPHTPPNENDKDMNLHHESMHSISGILTAYANRILQHPALSQAADPTNMQIRLALAEYLRAQVESALNRSSSIQTISSGRNLFDWVRTLGADDTSCPYSFAFYIALSNMVLGGKKRAFNVRTDYLKNALCRSLATMCRMYNDYGSLSRDRYEGNLNCIDFFDRERTQMMSEGILPLHKQNSTRKRNFGELNGEYRERKRQKVTADALNNHTLTHLSPALSDGEQSRNDSDAKQELMRLAEFERSCMKLAVSGLKDSGLEVKELDALLLFIDVTDLFGQIYVARDIGTKTKREIVSLR